MYCTSEVNALLFNSSEFEWGQTVCSSKKELLFHPKQCIWCLVNKTQDTLFFLVLCIRWNCKKKSMQDKVDIGCDRGSLDAKLSSW